MISCYRKHVPRSLALIVMLHLALANATSKSAPKLLPIAVADSYTEGSEVALLCNVRSGDRPFSYTWLKNSRQVHVADDPRLEVEHESVVSRLSIRNVSRQDTANYTCVVRNQFGQDSTGAQLVINVELKWVDEPRDVTVSAGQSINVKCSVEADGRPLVKWSRLTLDSSVELGKAQVGANQLIIGEAKESDSGLYECVASNQADRLRRVISIMIKGKYRIF